MTTPLVMLVGKGRSGKDTAGEAIARELGGVCVALADPIKRFARVFGCTADQLWGKGKEVEFTRVHPWVEDCWKAFSEALSGWRTPAELTRLRLERWLRDLPSQTTPRHILQTFGTECVRDTWPDFWVAHGLWVAERLLCEDGYVYERELGLKKAGGPEAPTPANVVCFTDGRFRNEAFKVLQAGGLLLEVWRPTAQDGFSAAAKTHRSETESSSIPGWWFSGRIENDGTLGQFQCAAVGLARALLGT